MKNKLSTQTMIRYKKMRLLVGNVEDKVVLDIGAGRRPISKGIKTKKTLRLDGVKKYSPDICCDLSNGIPLDNNSIDMIIAGEIIEHMYNPYKFIQECSRILRKGGTIVLSVPNLCSLKNRFRVLLGRLPESCAEPSNDESYERHIVDFNFCRLQKVFEKNGLNIIKKTSNGIISHGKLLWPLSLTPTKFGETLIVKGIKKH